MIRKQAKPKSSEQSKTEPRQYGFKTRWSFPPGGVNLWAPVIIKELWKIPGFIEDFDAFLVESEKKYLTVTHD